MSSKLQLDCPAAVNIFNAPSPTPQDLTTSQARLRKRLEMSVDEGERKNFKDLIPILFQGEVMDFIITEQPMYGSLMDSSDVEIEEFSSGGFSSISLASQSNSAAETFILKTDKSKHAGDIL